MKFTFYLIFFSFFLNNPQKNILYLISTLFFFRLKNKSYLIAISSVFSTYSIISTIILWSVSACVKTSWLSGICLKSLKLKKKQKHFRTKLCMLKVRQLNTSVFSHKFQQYFSYIMVVSWEVNIIPEKKTRNILKVTKYHYIGYTCGFY